MAGWASVIEEHIDLRNTYYFAYGSNINLNQMFKRCPDARVFIQGKLKGYKLMFRRVADIDKCKGREVSGMLYKLSRSDVQSLDLFEGYPTKYTKKTGIIETEQGSVKAFWYEMVNKVDTELPSSHYLARIITGYAMHSIPSSTIIDSLYRTENAVRNRLRKAAKRMVSQLIDQQAK
jgi:gamma-glutamylcyclotransferase (GGCT)/AIG2-like uncharacterized protein YtfP